MPNHQDLYLYNEIISANKHQQIILGSHKDRPHQRVVINKIYKDSFILPVDVHSFINGFTQLVMLEEDPQHWYILTKKEEGTLALAPFNLHQLNAYLNWIKNYDNLAPFYQYLLLKDNNWLLKDDQLISKEILFLDDLPEGFIDFHLVRAKVNQVMTVSVLNLLESGLYSASMSFTLESITPLTEATTELGNLVKQWQSFLQALSLIPQPTKLENLYAVPSDESLTPMAKRRVAETLKAENSQYIDYQNKRSQRNKLNPAILATLAICVVALVAIFLPSIKSLFAPSAEDQSSNTPTNQISTQTVSKPSTTEQLKLDNIQLEGNQWAIDKDHFYTGTESLRLQLTKDEPTGVMTLSPVALTKNTTISLWLKSSMAGTVTLKVSLYDHQTLLKEIISPIVVEAPQTWYMVSPLGTYTLSNPEKVSKMTLSFEGEPQTIWIDDLVIESFK